MTPEEYEKKIEELKKLPNVHFLTQPKYTEDGFVNPAFIKELEGLLKFMEENRDVD